MTLRLVLDLPDDQHLQLLVRVLADAGDVRMHAAAIGAREAVEDPTVSGDLASSGIVALHHLAEADWLRMLSQTLPGHVLTPAPASDPAVAQFGQSATYPTVPPVPAAATPAPPPNGHRPPRPAGDGDLTLRQMTLSPGARVTPGSPPVAAPAGPPPVPPAPVDEWPETIGSEPEDAHDI